MASDQINVTEGSGKAVATETISSKDYQLIKLVDATAASTTRTGVAANPLQVTVATALPAGTAAIGKLAANSGVDIGDVDIGSALPAGTNAIGKLAANSGVDIGDVDVTSTTTATPQTSGGYTVNRNIDVDETEDDVKTSAGQIYGYFFANVATSWRYLKFYNATAANTTVGTTTPYLTFPLPPGSAGHIDFGCGIPFATALCVAATTAVADNDTGAPSANDCVVNVFFK